MTFDLDAHALGQRRASILAMLDRLGDAVLVEQGSKDDDRLFTFSVHAPHDAPFEIATFEYEEAYRRARSGRWALRFYRYEFQQRPPPGRRAHHWHDPWEHHAHCIDPREPRRHPHYRDVAVDVFEAHTEFLRWYASGEPMSCVGLFPLAR